MEHQEPDWAYLSAKMKENKHNIVDHNNIISKEITEFENLLKSKLNDNINSPSHYTQGGIETIDYIQSKLTHEQFEGYLAGNILKYVSRYPHKNGIEDLKKAGWYLDKLVKVKEGSE